MPELIEVERYREAAAAVLGRRISRVVVVDPRVVSPTRSSLDELVGCRVTDVRRRGKLLLIDTSAAAAAETRGPVLGLRFGMTGSLVVDGEPAIERLRYSSPASAERAVRLRIAFDKGGELAVHDPRRFGRAQLEPDESVLGPEARGIGVTQFRSVLAVRRSPGPPLKARLLDQSRLAGLGNLLVDEILWRTGLSPLRPCDALSDDEVRRLARGVRGTVEALIGRGGSHTGDLMEERRRDGRCPRDGAVLARTEVGGRTSFWCPVHQQ
ncbi:MAG TPA: DNA-formamidopyrimidine glycosylase family protein [Acidimicrobiales bacterium]|nr:DNA-formamidopyrimidine glycosylase family protein [Acidimicrobiales bacterium]